jgi:hypothetical protein
MAPGPPKRNQILHELGGSAFQEPPLATPNARVKPRTSQIEARAKHAQSLDRSSASTIVRWQLRRRSNDPLCSNAGRRDVVLDHPKPSIYLLLS